MSLELELDSIHKLKWGDCLEICGIIGNTTFEVVFLSDNKPKFKFSIDCIHGWDVYAWDRTTCDINSGSINSFLEYNQNSQFTLCFHVKRNQILTLLNENLLSTTNTVFPVENINTLKVCGENFLKYISFSDCSYKSSRVLQPTIHNSVERKENKGNESVTVIESRQRIIFKKTKNSENDNYYCSDSENESEDEVFQIKDFHADFSYFNKMLEESKSKKDDNFSYRYPNECPENKYFINYFNPSEFISDSDDLQTNSETQSFSTHNNNNSSILDDEEKFNKLKLELDKINENLKNSCNNIVQLDSKHNSISSDEDIRSFSQTETVLQTKSNHSFKIPILKSASSVVNIKIVNNSNKSKIPVLSTNYQNGKVKTIPIIDKYKTRKIEISK